jgi:hypothetical protein
MRHALRHPHPSPPPFPRQDLSTSSGRVARDLRQGGGNYEVIGHAPGAHILESLGVFDDNPQIAIHRELITGMD